MPKNEKIEKLLKRNGEYWSGRFLYLEKVQSNKNIEYFHNLEKQYNEAVQTVTNDINNWYMRFAENNKITFTITSADNSDLPEVTLYTAEYDENGELLGVKLNNGEVADGTLTITSDFPETSNYKFMLWDDTKCPLTNTITTVN